jgi:hypothetical protein
MMTELNNASFVAKEGIAAWKEGGRTSRRLTAAHCPSRDLQGVWFIQPRRNDCWSIGVAISSQGIDAWLLNRGVTVGMADWGNGQRDNIYKL